MTSISLMVAIDEERGIGKDNQLLCHLPADLLHFKAMTMGKPVIMGRKTYESIGKALPGRLNIVLSQKKINLEDATVVDSLEKAIALAFGVNEVMIIGGAQVFKEALLLVSRIYVTVIHETFEADVFFPSLDPKIWRCRTEIKRPSDEKNKYAMTFQYFEK